MCDAFICSEKEEFYRRYAYTAFMVTTVPIGNRMCINYTENNNMMHRFLAKKYWWNVGKHFRLLKKLSPVDHTQVLCYHYCKHVLFGTCCIPNLRMKFNTVQPVTMQNNIKQ